MRSKTKNIAIILATALTLCCSGCEKKAAVVDGLQMSDAESVSDDNSDNKIKNNTKIDSENTSKDLSEDSSSDKSKNDSKSVMSELARWSEHIDGNGLGFDYVDIKSAEFIERDASSFVASTVEVVEFDKDYIKKLCDMVFDGGQVEVYDFDNRTQRVYDDLITQYENLLEIYDYYKENDSNALNQYPFQLFSYGGWELRPNTEEFERSVIENDLNQLKAEREEAPETIENDYSYGGYIGKIDGEEYYMFLGNRKYDEYLSAPDTFQRNGRVITIMKADMEGAFRGQSRTVDINVLEGIDDLDEIDDLAEVGAIAETDDSANCVNEKNAIATDYLMEGYHTDTEPDEKYLLEADRFLNKIGYGSFTNNNYETVDLLWGNSVNLGFLYAKDYHMSVHNNEVSDGQCLFYEMSGSIGGFPSGELLDLSDYFESDLLDSDAYIKVMVNDSGIVGCQIYNPIRILNTDEIKSLLDIEDIKDIVKESINDKDLWNIPINQNVNCFEINELRMISFPLKSDKNNGEYMYVPCYMVWNASSEYNSPFLVINAIDGSIINIEEELSGYPAGWLRPQ